MSCCTGILSEIMGISEDIDFVGIYHNHSSQLENEFHENLEIYFEEGDVVQNSNQVLLSKRVYGPVRYAMARYEDIIRYTFAVNDHTLLLISTGSYANSDLVISRILDYLRQ